MDARLGAAAPTVLALDGVVLPDGGDGRLDLALAEGDLCLIEAEGPQVPALVDVAAGLSAPASGRARFLDRDWAAVSPDVGNAMRGRIGHLFATGAWLPHIPVCDNILLPRLHHTRRPVKRLMEEATPLASALGLPGLPLELPPDVSPSDLQRAAFVRALLGEPALVILEDPLRDLPAAAAARAINVLHAAMVRGAAILWIAPDLDALAEVPIPATHRLRLARRGLEPVEAKT